jgi:CRISPR-associated endonuclease Cas2
MSTNIFIITYDLNSSGQDYKTLYEAIKQYNYKKMQGSVWVIKSNNTASNIRDNLKKYIDKNDSLFVGEINHWAGISLNGAGDWMNN